MEVVMRVALSGTRNGEEWPPAGSVVDLPDAEAEHLITAGLAVRVEKAVAPPAPRLEPPTPEASRPAAPEKRGRGRPRLPRDADGNVIRE